MAQRYKKKDLLDIVASLQEAAQALCDNAQASVGVLADCQEAAVAIGNYVEAFYPGSTEIVGLLERYCENLYQLSLVIQDDIQCRKITKKIRAQLVQLSNKIEYELPEDKKEVVFLPYKASMWDSLESVWEKAMADESCEVFVVPIPYYDKNPDGTLGQIHYEGDEYPDYVPITSWESYHLAERRPDVIYIHNPYDRCNHVTSVHPHFYAENLRKYTDMLVYIPYFVAISDNVEKHFCVLPGVIYAHRVIVQSEPVRQTYIEEFRKFEEKNNCKGMFGDIEEKIVAGGSPKFDKVQKSKREDFPLPEEWAQKIYQPDGSCRKVILYNTTLSAMLENTEAMLDKIERTLQIFRENQNNENNIDNENKGAVLLWRPHPLYKETLKAMRPELYARYLALEDSCRQEPLSILDDSADLYRAITWSDAYYGDWSSVVELYKHTGKPIMIQNVTL